MNSSMSDIYKLKRLNFAILVIIFSIFIFGVITLLYTGHKSIYYAKLINIAGKQRVLSQKIIFELTNHFLLNDKNAFERLEKRVSEYSSNEKKLLNIINKNDLDININIFKNELIKNFIEAALLYIKAPNEKAHNELVNKRDKIFDEFDNFVNYCEQSYHQIYLYTLKKLSIIGLLNLIMIIFYYLVVFKKSMHYLNKYIKTIETLSITDALTNLYNRRFFNEIFQKKLSFAIREKNKFCLFMCDIDNFKNYNDTHGHQMGDNALIDISKNLKSYYFNRAGDFVFRVGGEEFAAILNIEKSDNIDSFIVKLLKNIENLNIEHKGNHPFGVLTISCGVIVADFAQVNKLFSTDDLYKMVDDELYKAKQNGRNKVSSSYLS